MGSANSSSVLRLPPATGMFLDEKHSYDYELQSDLERKSFCGIDDIEVKRVKDILCRCMFSLIALKIESVIRDNDKNE